MWNAFLLVIALSLDSFLASLAYGGEHIRIPWKSAVLISLIGVLFLSFSLYTAAFIQQFIPPYICRMISFTIFFMIGLSSLFQGTIKSFLGTYKRKKLSFEYSGISFVLDIYLDETKADADNSKLLSLKEALYLAVIHWRAALRWVSALCSLCRCWSSVSASVYWQFWGDPFWAAECYR